MSVYQSYISTQLTSDQRSQLDQELEGEKRTLMRDSTRIHFELMNGYLPTEQQLEEMLQWRVSQGFPVLPDVPNGNTHRDE